MTDARALLAAERQSRRISHPNLTYTKNGALICNICDLNIKSEQLWPGHLKSTNHRKNAQQKAEAVAAAHPVKRKRDSFEAELDDERSYEVDSRKKPRSATQSFDADAIVAVPETILEDKEVDTTYTAADAESMKPDMNDAKATSTAEVDEDEWAAFERDVAEVAQPDYAAATIEAAPVSAAELAQGQDVDNVQRREDEAEAEKEDESRRMEDEFEVMEEMEDRVRKLRERREALRTPGSATKPRAIETEPAVLETPSAPTVLDDASESSDGEDDWYG